MARCVFTSVRQSVHCSSNIGFNELMHLVMFVCCLRNRQSTTQSVPGLTRRGGSLMPRRWPRLRSVSWACLKTPSRITSARSSATPTRSWTLKRNTNSTTAGPVVAGQSLSTVINRSVGVSFHFKHCCTDFDAPILLSDASPNCSLNHGPSPSLPRHAGRHHGNIPCTCHLL